jgi:hypothetical protein
MRSCNGSNGTPLDPPLFWLDNIFGYLKHQIFKDWFTNNALSVFQNTKYKSLLYPLYTAWSGLE